VEAVTADLAAFGNAVWSAIDQSASRRDRDTSDIFAQITRGVGKSDS
jgi:hypothetical protein